MGKKYRSFRLLGTVNIPECSRPNKRVFGALRCWTSMRIMPLLALWRGERSDCTIKSEMPFSVVCQKRRLADVLFVPTPLCRQSQWALYPHITLDFAVVSPFKVGEFQVATEKA